VARSTESSIVTKCAMVMDVLSHARQPLAFSEIVQKTGFVKSSCHRILTVLQGETLVAYDPKSRTYTPGPRLHQWARSAWRRIDLQQAAADEMADLSDRTAMNTALSVLDGDTILYLRTVDYLPFRLASRPGDHAPLHCTAAGKMFLAHLSKPRRNLVLPSTTLEKYTEFTKVTVQALEEEFPQILEQGYATAHQEEFLKVVGLAAPVRNSEGGITACLSLWTMDDDLSQGEIDKSAVEAKSTADAISRKLGWSEQ
jgi:DNA-binding IclR family transcriptional regulator